jgi:NarL family two-component system sensor histidine kinase YdfH
MAKKLMSYSNQKPLLRWFLLVWLGLVYIQSLQSLGIVASMYSTGSGTKVAPGAGNSPQFDLVAFTILMLLHGGLHWLAFSLKKIRDLLLYFLGQGILVLLIYFIAHANDAVFYLCLALIIEVVTLLNQPRLILLVAGGCLLLFVLVEGMQVGPLLADGSTNSMNKVSNALATSLTLILFVMACVMLYIQQRQAHRRDQVMLDELESAHTRLKTTHDQLEATHRQLEEYAAQVEDLTLIAERQRLARELHDTLVQGLVGLTMQLETIDALLLKQQGEQARTIAQQAMSHARSTMTQARAAIEDLRAEAPNMQLFAQMVQGEIQRFTSATGIACTCSLPKTSALPAAFHEPFLHLVSEGLMNIARHAQATRAWVRGTCHQDTITFEVGDDGIGFDPPVVAQQAGHYGLLGLRERARLLQGQLDIVSVPGQGTTLRLHLPVENRGTRDER